jgi:hypothetical protein
VIKRHWRKVADFLLVAAFSGLVATHVGSTFLPDQEVSLEIGFSDNGYTGAAGTPTPNPGLSFGILDGSGTGSICGQSTNAAYRNGRDSLIGTGHMTVYSFWFLSAYNFATIDCGLDFSQFGYAYGWGVYNAHHFIDFMKGAPWPCGSPQGVFGDVEYFDDAPGDTFRWGRPPEGQTYSDNWSANRSVIRGFEDTVADEVGLCGKYLKGVYSTVGDWGAITNSGTKSATHADWFWLADYTDPNTADLASERDTIEGQVMSVFSWQYATDPGCQISSFLAAVEAGNAGIPKIDKWHRPDRDCSVPPGLP